MATTPKFSNKARVQIVPPDDLPSKGMTSIKYKQWKVALKIYTHHTPEFIEYYPGGMYEKWDAMEDNVHRISALHPSELKKDAEDENKTLLQHRRLFLETFLGILAKHSDEGDFDDIMEKSTSLEFIFKIHETRYGIQRQGRHFIRIDSIRFDKATMEDHYKFYTDLRSCFKSNMLKKGDPIHYKNTKMKEDETISPTTEVFIITLALERIDSRLPGEIDRIFGHRLTNGYTLMDFCSEIFAYIPRALATLDREDIVVNAFNLNNMSQQLPEEDHENMDELQVNAMAFRPRQQNRPQQRNFRYNSNQRPQRTKSCDVCKALGLPDYVINSHDASRCRKKIKLQQMVIQEYSDPSEQHDDQQLHIESID